MPEAHSKFSASASARWMACPGSMVLSKDKVDRSSVYADEGTAAHALASWCLEESKDASAYVGRVVPITNGAVDQVEVTEDMARHVQVYLDIVREYAEGSDALMVERRVNYSAAIGVDTDDGWGTSDVIIAKGNLLIVGDLKFGQGEQVEAEDNTQMQLYALGAMAEFDGITEFDRVLMFISQPRSERAPREWEISVAELLEFGKTARAAAEKVLDATMDYPSGDWHDKYTQATQKGCRWCKAKATCPTARAAVAEAVMGNVPASPDDFDCVTEPVKLMNALADDPVQWIAACLSKVDLIEDWCKAVRAEAEARMLRGEQVPGYKLVQGKRGARAWSDAAQAEAMLKTFRLKQEEMYDLKLISPTTAEKLAAAETIGKRQWPKLQTLITQPDGKLHVAPVTDKRPAVEVKPVDEEFDDVSAGGATVDDLA